MPPPKPESAAPGNAKPAASRDEAAETPVAPAPRARGIRPVLAAWAPAVAAVLLAPVGTWATVEFVLVPRLQKKIAAAAEAAPVANAGGSADGKGDGKGKEASPGYEFQNVVVNLAGSAGTRYLKVSFLVTGADANLRSAFEAAKPRVTDVTLNVLSALTLADLEEPGAKNVIREKLVLAYNQVLGRKVADQVYFSDFVIQ